MQRNPPGRREFDRIREQVQQNLFNTQTIADQYIGRIVIDLFEQCQTLLLRLETNHRAAAPYQLAQTEWCVFELHASGGNFREIKQIIDDAGQRFTGTADVVQILTLVRIGSNATRQV